MNYLQWNNVIINHFFNTEKEEKEVILYFSEKIINEIGEKNFEMPENGYLEDFFRALRVGVNGTSNIDYIERIIDLETRYRSGTRGVAGCPLSYPPYFTYLLVFILPFTSGELQEGFSMNNFHDIAKDYFEKEQLTANYDKYIRLHLRRIDFLWKKINNWLIEKNNFSLGYLEEINDPSDNRKYVSKFEYHILFRKEQEERLSKVFDSNNILPNDIISEKQIKSLLIENSNFLKLSLNTKSKIQKNDYIGDKIVKRAYNFYKKWNGETHIVEGERGYSRKKLVLCLNFNLLSQSIKIKYFRVYSKDVLPENSILKKSNGEEIKNFSQIRELYSNPINNCYVDHKSDVELIDESNRIKYNWKAKEFYLFKRVPHLDWIEMPRVEFNVGKTLIICKTDLYENKLKEWFDSISGAKKLYTDHTKTSLEEDWIAFYIENITNYPHSDLTELKPLQEEKPKINFDKEFYANGLIFKNRLPNVWIENFEGNKPIAAIYNDGSEISLKQNYEIEKDENGDEFSYPINNHSFTSEHVDKTNISFKLYCEGIEKSRFLKISDFGKIENLEIEAQLPKRNGIEEIENIETNYIKGIEHFFSEEKITALKPYQNLLDTQNGIFKNTVNANSYTKNGQYNPNHLGNILLNYISTKGKLSKFEFDQAVFKLLRSAGSEDHIKKRANNLRYQLQDTGYIDYNSNNSNLYINKSQLVIKPTDAGTTVILAGARDDNLVDNLIKQITNNSSIVIDIQNETDPLFPQLILIKFKNCSHQLVREFANKNGMVFKKSGLYTQFALASHYNNISEWKTYIFPVENALEDFEGGFIFDLDKLSFIQKEEEFDKQLAFVKFTGISGYKTIYRLWYKGTAYNVSNQQFGIYLYLFLYKETREENYNIKKEEKGWSHCREEFIEKENAPKLTNIILYDTTSKYLAVPLYCGLPRFYATSIALLTGRKPDINYLDIQNIRHKGRYLIYRNVPSLFIKNIFVNLQQKLNYTEII